MFCNIFNTREEALEAQANDYLEWKTNSQQKQSYWITTTKWDDVRQRVTDNKWFYATCPYVTTVYTKEAYDDTWIPIISDM